MAQAQAFRFVASHPKCNAHESIAAWKKAFLAEPQTLEKYEATLVNPLIDLLDPLLEREFNELATELKLPLHVIQSFNSEKRRLLVQQHRQLDSVFGESAILTPELRTVSMRADRTRPQPRVRVSTPQPPEPQSPPRSPDDVPPPPPESFKKFSVGMKVEYQDNESKWWRGTIRYIGPVAGKEDLSPMFIGVELEKPYGRNDGSVRGHSYFKCPPLCGVFTLPDSLKRQAKKEDEPKAPGDSKNRLTPDKAKEASSDRPLSLSREKFDKEPSPVSSKLSREKSARDPSPASSKNLSKERLEKDHSAIKLKPEESSPKKLSREQLDKSPSASRSSQDKKSTPSPSKSREKSERKERDSTAKAEAKEKKERSKNGDRKSTEEKISSKPRAKVSEESPRNDLSRGRRSSVRTKDLDSFLEQVESDVFGEKA